MPSAAGSMLTFVIVAGPAGDQFLQADLHLGPYVATRVGLGLLWLAALLTLYTGWDYMKAGIKHTMSEAEPK